MEPPKRSADSERAPSERFTQRPRLDTASPLSAPAPPPASPSPGSHATAVAVLCERLIDLLRAGTPLEEAFRALDRLARTSLGTASVYPTALLRDPSTMGLMFQGYSKPHMWRDLLHAGTWVPFALLDTAEGFIPEHRLGLLRRMLEAGLPASHHVKLLLQDWGDMSLLSVALVVGLLDEARLLHSFGARLATSKLGRYPAPRGSLQDDIFLHLADRHDLIRLCSRLTFSRRRGGPIKASPRSTSPWSGTCPWTSSAPSSSSAQEMQLVCSSTL